MTEPNPHNKSWHFHSGWRHARIAQAGGILLIVLGLFTARFLVVDSSNLEPEESIFSMTEGTPFAAIPDDALAINVWGLLRDTDFTCQLGGWEAEFETMVVVLCPTVELSPENRDRLSADGGAIDLIDLLDESWVKRVDAPSGERPYGGFKLPTGYVLIDAYRSDDRRDCLDFSHVNPHPDERGALVIFGQVCLGQGRRRHRQWTCLGTSWSRVGTDASRRPLSLRRQDGS